MTEMIQEIHVAVPTQIAANIILTMNYYVAPVKSFNIKSEFQSVEDSRSVIHIVAE